MPFAARDGLAVDDNFVCCYHSACRRTDRATHKCDPSGRRAGLRQAGVVRRPGPLFFRCVNAKLKCIHRRDDLGTPDSFDVYYGMADSRVGVATLTVPQHLPTTHAAKADAPDRVVETEVAEASR